MKNWYVIAQVAVAALMYVVNDSQGNTAIAVVWLAVACAWLLADYVCDRVDRAPPR